MILITRKNADSFQDNYYSRGVKLIFTGGLISLEVAFKGPNVILGLYKCNYSSTVKRGLSAAAG